MSDLDVLGPVLVEHHAEDGRHVLLGDAEGEQQYWRLGPNAGRRLAALVPLDGDLSLRLESVRRLYRRLQGKPAGPPPRR
nr:hypothetical protein [Caulobacter sp. S45]